MNKVAIGRWMQELQLRMKRLSSPQEQAATQAASSHPHSTNVITFAESGFE